MKVGISINPRMPVAHELSKRAQGLIAREGHRVVAEEGKTLAGMEVDLLLCIGGDGTILRALQVCDAPVLGVNTSIVGFLSEVAPEEMEAALKRALAGDYTLEERMRMEVHLDGRRLPDATNEALVHAAPVGHLRHFHLWVDADLAVDAAADGLVVATPTGSTAYSLSAGGPLVDPRTEAWVVTAIAPFRLTFRPLVVPASSRLRMVLSTHAPCSLIIDGQGEHSMKGSEEVRLQRSPRPARFVRFKQDFYTRVNERLAFKQGLKYHGGPIGDGA